jgi:hypothetical protein
MLKSMLVLIAGLFLSSAHAAGVNQIHLNHFYVSVDEADYQAIMDSSFLKDVYGSYEMRTTVRTDRTYTGQYLYGTNTYMEFFNAADMQNDPTKARNAIAFGVDGTGLGAGPGLTYTAVTRNYKIAQDKEIQIPWFQMWVVANGTLPKSGVLATWLMEYLPEFLLTWHPELGTPNGVTRGAVLTRYKAQISKTNGRDQSSRLFDDLQEIHAEFTQDEIDLFAKWAKSLGCGVGVRDGQTVVQADAQTIYLQAGPLNKIRSAKVSLSKAAAAQTLRFGNKTFLKLNGDGTATWYFEGLSKL